ncbi:guanosine-3',5'-bis(diphosphate) 3'-pyrophosphohydrolase MESH1 [Coccinella septempunctata]|uniref:guanosine-3',5'-bis(diphosphate) 3'-pyrophosphohydrolase MESH1 n=1 Tax=Coccinella septempunctata TaxID=41139 RepID=UPI001D065D4C|nr:guanosine-3',5'-bis(diphosphate) 3'-pyrophosphohydrolase MESH1 [Coccinella septempunctata]
MNSLPENVIISDLIECVNFACIKHKDQRRKDIQRTPYINHPIGVAFILTNEAKVTDLATIKAAILHDTVEDTDTTLEEIENVFGKEVGSIVAEVTDDKSLPKEMRKQLQIEHAPGSSLAAKLVKLADKLYNLRDLERSIPTFWSQQRVQEYFEWSKKVVDGLRGVNCTLENELDKIFARRLKKTDESRSN